MERNFFSATADKQRRDEQKKLRSVELMWEGALTNSMDAHSTNSR
jgi:hypothetical protein